MLRLLPNDKVPSLTGVFIVLTLGLMTHVAGVAGTLNSTLSPQDMNGKYSEPWKKIEIMNNGGIPPKGLEILDTRRLGHMEDGGIKIQVKLLYNPPPKMEKALSYRFQWISQQGEELNSTDTYLPLYLKPGDTKTIKGVYLKSNADSFSLQLQVDN